MITTIAHHRPPPPSQMSSHLSFTELKFAEDPIQKLFNLQHNENKRKKSQSVELCRLGTFGRKPLYKEVTAFSKCVMISLDATRMILAYMLD